MFLRELISNASDALDHLAFRALTEPDVMGDDTKLEIRIALDKDARTVSISDNGVGMTHDQLVQNLGTIAHSGTKRLAEQLTGDQKDDISLIGQFGVGFYSAFMVADRVDRHLAPRAAAEEAWTAGPERGPGRATRSWSPPPARSRGTDIVLHLKTDEDADDFLREWTVRDLVRKYSDYVRHPIRLRTEKTEGEGDDAATVVEWEQVNSGSALWTRPKSDITDEQADDFYKHLTRDWEPPLARTHFKTEGMQSLTGLLFVPRRSPMDLYMSREKGIRLFVKRVFIMENCEELLPDYLRFVRGVVDSDDLPLNVSREFLQKDRTTAAIRKQVVRHVLRLLQEMADEEDAARKQRETVEDDAGEASSDESDDGADEKADDAQRYTTFWTQFGRLLKEGIHSDATNREKLARLLRYETSHGEGLHSLADIVSRMDAEQESIYYIVAPSRAAAESAPHVEALRKRGLEVVYMIDPIDEWVVDSLTEHEGKRFVSASKGALDLPESDDDKKELEEQKETLSGLVERMKGVLTDDVEDVRLTSRLTDSPACLVVGEGGIAPHVERLLRAQNADMPAQKRILEINPTHPVVERMNALAGDDAPEAELADWSRLLYDQALVAEGSPPSDPAGFARRITALLTKALG